jgi:histidyl-tRNA synthetase
LLVLGEAAKADPNSRAAQVVTAPKPDAYLVNRGAQAEQAALALARALRSQGLSVELDSSGSAFGKQFKRADRCGARFALVLGDEEASRGEVLIKPLLEKGDESTWAIDAISAMVDVLQSR